MTDQTMQTKLTVTRVSGGTVARLSCCGGAIRAERYVAASYGQLGPYWWADALCARLGWEYPVLVAT